MSDNNWSELLNNNVQYFIDNYGMSSDKHIIDGVQKMIAHWCGIEQNLDTVPPQSIGIFKMMSNVDCRNTDFLKIVDNYCRL